MIRHEYLRSLLITLFFLTFFLVGFSVYKDFGVSWDEPRCREAGLVSLKYVSELIFPDFSAHDSELRQIRIPLDHYVDRDYGVGFELPVALLERQLGLQDSKDIFFFRHLCTYLISFAGILAVFFLAYRRFEDWRIGLLGALFLILSPRMFAESFYNSKDLVFMSLFAISVNTLIKYILKPNNLNAWWHAFATALVIDVRLMGVIIPAVTLAVIFIRVGRKEIAPGTIRASLLLYVVFTIGLIILFWPYLWKAPLHNFAEAFTNMMRFDRWIGLNLYLGHLLQGSQLPWHYIPVWLLITTPLFHTICFIWGSGAILRKLLNNGWSLYDGDAELQDLIFLGLFLSPLCAVILLNSILYDGWRQMYFIYPLFILIAVRGWLAIAHSASSRYRIIGQIFIATVTISCLTYTAVWMVRSHPFQNVYFNILVGENKRYKFDVDYWGLSSRQALQYIADNDDSTAIKVWAGSRIPLGNGKLLLETPNRNRLHIVKKENSADYVITQYRLNFTDYGPNGRGYEPHYDIIVDGEPIISVYRR